MNPTAKPLEADIQRAIQDGFFYQYRIRLETMDAGGRNTRALNSLPVLFDPPYLVLEALKIPSNLAFGIEVALRLPPGFPDLAAPIVPGLPDVWLFIECKRPGCKPDRRQQHFLETARKSGHLAIWADSLSMSQVKFETEFGKLRERVDKLKNADTI
jgi:hypothetical protein